MNTSLFAELFGGAARFHALRCLFEQPARLFGLRELAKEADVDSGNLSRWLQRWCAVGLVQQPEKMRYRASSDPALQPLILLFQQSSSMLNTLKALLAELAGVEAAAIFGSVARNEESASSDVDILIIGDISEIRVNALLQPIERQFDRAFNASVFSRSMISQLQDQGDPLIATLLDGPTLLLKGDPHVFADLGRSEQKTGHPADSASD
ncbi:Nucleotidyltransferase domain-containing protein [Duganella sp. CF402]|uniref:nucleotidyltransferase family protein n=1 Tax=unclassified Duganella TaxID=2636909 RepID=UPI0008D02C1C|nr:MULTISPECIES: nucleotidyltransferase domain-containing protein [unclassified Duganella]SEL65837.1 Nucleotidyltransferase domain-containing protein [Duganella sp. CF402]